MQYQFGSGCSASFDLGQWSAQKQGVKQQDAFVFSIMGKMRLPFAKGTRGCTKLAPKFATDNLSKGRSMAKKRFKNSGFGEIRERKSAQKKHAINFRFAVSIF